MNERDPQNETPPDEPVLSTPRVDPNMDTPVDKDMPTLSIPPGGFDTDLKRSSPNLGSAQSERVGRYTLVSELGRGGQGVVYRALHPELPIELALKVCHYNGDAQDERALREEAKTLCELEHPSIARIRDLELERGPNGEKRCILVLDYIRGQSLAALFDAGQVELTKGAGWLSKVAEAVDYAHRRGVLHLDLKPQNIAIDENGEPRVIDFGLARVRGAFASSNDADGISGTFGFMSPEQASGEASRIGARSDVFALGALLYVLITGESPIRRASLFAMLEQAKSGVYDHEQLQRSDAPEQFKAICVKAMSKRPEDRYGTAQEFANALDAVLAPIEQPTIHSSPESKEQPEAESRKWPIALGCLLLLGAFGIAAYFLGSAGPSPNIGDTPWIVSHISGQGDFEGELFKQRRARVEDELGFYASFEPQKYCFLLALNPSGKLQLIFPRDGSQPPVAIGELPDAVFGLNDGAGAQGFILVASEAPLPAFDDWDAPLKSLEWSKTAVTGAWKYRSGRLASTFFNEGGRGDIRPREKPAGIQAVLDAIDQGAGVDVQGVFFEVVEAY